MLDNRIRLQPLDDNIPDREIYIGWDRGLGTYFAQVFDSPDPDGEDVLLVACGYEVDEITDPAEAIDAVRPYAHIPDTLAGDLVAQRDAPGAREKSPFTAMLLQAQAGVDTPASTPATDRTPQQASAADLVEACGLDTSLPAAPGLEVEPTTPSTDAAGPDAAEAGP